MKNTFMVALAFLFMSSAAFCEEASDKSIRELMQRTGSGDLGIQMMHQMLPALKSMVPDAPETFWEDFMSEVDADELIEMTIPIYKKYLTEEDIVELNKFYDSPVGRKMIEVQPALMQESMAAGQAWGQKIGQEVINRYKAQKP